MSDPYLWTNGEGEIVHPNAPVGGGGPGIFKGTAPLGSKIDLELADIPHPRSPLGMNSAPTNEHFLELDSGMADPASTDEQPTINEQTPKLLDVHADTVDDFVTGANAKLAEQDAVGHLEAAFKMDAELNDKGNVVKVNLTVTTRIVRPRWSGGRPSDSEKALIKKAEQLVKEHEERHRDIAHEAARNAVKAIRGKSAKKADELYHDLLEVKLPEAQDKLDAKEGMLFVEHKSGKATDVKLGPPK